MELKNVKVIPGVVIDGEDPKRLGRIKCVANGEFDNATMKTEHMHWCKPFTCGSGYQNMSKPIKGQKIWLLHDSTNYYDYWYIPYWEPNQNTMSALKDDYDVVVSRSGEGYGAQLFYNAQDGFIERIKNDGLIQMKPNCDILCQSNGAEVSIVGHEVQLGAIGGSHEYKAVLGEVLRDILTDLEQAFGMLSGACTVWTVAPLRPGFDAAKQAISMHIKKLLSTKVFLSK